MAKEKKKAQYPRFHRKGGRHSSDCAANNDLSKGSTGRVCAKAEEVEMMLEVGQGAWYLDWYPSEMRLMS